MLSLSVPCDEVSGTARLSRVFNLQKRVACRVLFLVSWGIGMRGSRRLRPYSHAVAPARLTSRNEGIHRSHQRREGD
jgi:hypothetical protein